MLSYAYDKSKLSEEEKDMADKKMETRVVKDVNGFWVAEMRFLPVEEWEQGEGWRGCYVSSSKEKAEQFFGNKEVA
jgi:hypothetical protein